MIEPKEIVIDGKKFVLSKFPAVDGRKITAKYSFSAIPKIGNYEENEEVMLLMMAYVGVVIDGVDKPMMLTTQSLIDNHCGNWERLRKIEWAIMEYNCSFLQDGRISNFLEDFVQNLPKWITQMLTSLSDQSSQTEKQASKS